LYRRLGVKEAWLGVKVAALQASSPPPEQDWITMMQKLP